MEPKWVEVERTYDGNQVRVTQTMEVPGGAVIRTIVTVASSTGVALVFVPDIKFRIGVGWVPA